MSEHTIEYDGDAKIIRITEPTLAAILLKHGTRPEGIEIHVEASVLNRVGCPDPLNGAGCPKPANPCPDGMCPFFVKLRFEEEIMQGVKEAAKRA